MLNTVCAFSHFKPTTNPGLEVLSLFSLFRKGKPRNREVKCLPKVLS